MGHVSRSAARIARPLGDSTLGYLEITQIDGDLSYIVCAFADNEELTHHSCRVSRSQGSKMAGWQSRLRDLLVRNRRTLAKAVENVKARLGRRDGHPLDFVPSVYTQNDLDASVHFLNRATPTETPGSARSRKARQQQRPTATGTRRSPRS
jgi:hypothetical protein